MLINGSLKLNICTEECGDVSVIWHLHQTGLSFLEFSSSLETFLDVKKFYSLSYAEQQHEGTKWEKGTEG